MKHLCKVGSQGFSHSIFITITCQKYHFKQAVVLITLDARSFSASFCGRKTVRFFFFAMNETKKPRTLYLSQTWG
jgi:hypothetical protein